MHATASQSSRARPLVAVIEVDRTAREALRVLLETLDVDVTMFDNAETYLDAQRRAQCLIAEMILPGMSGLELLRHLRTRGDNLPVILLADESDVPTAVAAMRAGASDFIEKPHADLAIVKRVAQLLRREQRRREQANRPDS